MKSLFTFCISILLLQTVLYSQDAKITDRPLEYSLLLGNKSLLNAPDPLAARKLTKKNSSHELNGRMYSPVKIVVDSTSRYTYSYDNNGNKIAMLYEYYEDGRWKNSSRTMSSYDDSGNLINVLDFSWYNGQWNNLYQDAYAYNKYGNLLTFLKQIWYNYWQTYYTEAYSYDKSGNQLSKIYINLYFDGEADSSRYIYTYDNNHNILTEFHDYQLKGVWKQQYRISYTYDAYGNMITALSESLEGRNDIHKKTYTYDGSDNLLSCVTEGFESGKWVKYYEEFYTYDNNGNILSYESPGNSRHLYTYDNSGNLITDLWQAYWLDSFTDIRKSAYTYDVYGNAIKGEAFVKENNAWASDSGWLNISFNRGKNNLKFIAEKVEIEYEALGKEVAPSVQDFNLLQNYPNPFNSSTTIRYSLRKEGNVKLTIYDALGNKVAVPLNKYKSAGTYYINFDGSGLPSGVYFYTLESGGSTTTKKFILMK